MIEPISFLPDTHQKKIQDCGGIRNFLMKSEQFVVQGNVVMLPDEHHFQEIVKNVNRYINSNKPSIKAINDSAMEYESRGNDSHEQSQANDITPLQSSTTDLDRQSPMNPEVTEFIPSSSSSSESMFTEDSSLTKDLSKENLATITSNTDVIKDEHLAPYEEAGIEPSSENLLKLLSNIGQSRSSGDQGRKEVAKNESLSRDVSQKLKKVDVFSVPTSSFRSVMELQTQTVGTNTPLGGGSSENLSRLNGQSEDLESKNTPGNGTEGMASLATPSKHKRAESSGSESTVGYKSKGVQTQLQVKAKGIMTDALPEPFKVEYLKASQEKEEMQRKLQDATEKLNNIQGRHSQELDKIKKKYVDVQSEREVIQ
jgi:hypothetical protein